MQQHRTGFTLIPLPNTPQATDTQRRVLVWPATHKRTGGGPLSDEELRLALTAPSAQASGIPALGFYFNGARVAFTDNEAPEVRSAPRFKKKSSHNVLLHQSITQYDLSFTFAVFVHRLGE
jgi:hypothetical protein